jgi:hypothetical protein
MKSEMEKRALAAREAHIALLDLKKLVEEAAQTAQDAEFEAAHLAIRPRTDGDIAPKVRKVLDRLTSADFESVLLRARENLQIAMS